MNKPKSLLHNKWLYIITIAVVGAWWWVSHNGDKDKKVPGPVRVTATQVKRQDVPVTVALVGNVIPYETVSVKSRLDSQIVNVAFRDGDHVNEGQTLFELDDRSVKAQVGELQAGLEKEKAQLVNTRLQYERNVRLVKTNAVSQAAVDDAKAAYQAQQAAVNAAQATLDNARVQLTYTVIKAPIGGKTGTINVTRGNNVKANDTTPLVVINQVSPIRVQFSIPQRYYEPLKTAMSNGEVGVDARHSDSSQTAKGRVEYLDNAIDVSNGTFAARGVFANEDEKLWPGMFVNVALDLGMQKNVLTIPSVALQGDEGNRFVFKLDAEGKKAVRTPVEISQNDGELTVVTNGLTEEDRVITDGLLRVNDGAAVEPVGAESPNASPPESPESPQS